MTLHRPRSGPSLKTPIERIFRGLVRREMTKEERRDFHLKVVRRIPVRP